MKFTRQRRFLFFFFLFFISAISSARGLWAAYIKYMENIEIEDSSRLLYILVGTRSEEGEGNLRSYSRSSSLHERLDSSKRLQGQDPDPRPSAFSYVRGVEREREREGRRVSVLAAISFPKRRTESPLTCQPAIIIAGNGSTPFFSSGNPDSSFSSSTVF